MRVLLRYGLLRQAGGKALQLVRHFVQGGADHPLPRDGYRIFFVPLHGFLKVFFFLMQHPGKVFLPVVFALLQGREGFPQKRAGPLNIQRGVAAARALVVNRRRGVSKLR